ncbi:putative disease resistance RPP13-like protein 1 [Rutidosis leptorrhynchoides]|uniref:putative disease resistance RPP13-like protein 1 n=1 Tax=Rutidosis leptorrhynchoides TaxID=125765 RepID=UPI003A99C330
MATETMKRKFNDISSGSKSPGEHRSNRNDKRLEETSLVEGSTILGREVDQEALLNKLLGDEACNQNVRMLSIVGLGGIGRTTLAQLMYNNKKVRDHFELKAWVCVSDEFDVLAISRAMYQAVSGEEKTFSNLDLLHVSLKEKLTNKRFILVLDDVWNEDHEKWTNLEKPLKGAPGKEDVLSLLAKSSLDDHNFDKHPSLISVARLIVKKCKGLPLVLIAIGRVLKGKEIVKVDWENLLKSEIWKENKSDILPALKLSYYDLPQHLKQLFAYCSLFPKDYLFKKDKLVLLWMADGFPKQDKGSMSMEIPKGVKLTRHSITNVPRSVGVLKHLWYLKFLRTNIKQVLEEVSDLDNLQSLLVHGCKELCMLPVSFVKLINLRHLDMSNNPLLRMTPLGIGLERVKNPQQANDANLQKKKGIVNLDMEWGDEFDASRNSLIEYEVFCRLRPATKLKKLNILNYGDVKFPSWFVSPSFDKLAELRVKVCRYLKHSHGIVFPSLEYLEVSDIDGLEILSTFDDDKTTESFPHLREIHIKDCPKLVEVSIGLIPLNEDNDACSKTKSVISYVFLFGCDSLESYNCPCIVESLKIFNCCSIKSLTFSTTFREIPSSLKFLKVGNFSNLVSMGEEEVDVETSNTKPVLRKVSFFGCDSLEVIIAPILLRIWRS